MTGSCSWMGVRPATPPLMGDGWTEGLTQADRRADWARLSPFWRAYNTDVLDEMVSELVVLPPDRAAEIAASIVAFFDFGAHDLGDILERARLFH